MLEVAVELHHCVRGEDLHCIPESLEVGGAQPLLPLLDDQMHLFAAFLCPAHDIRGPVRGIRIDDQDLAIPLCCREYHVDELIEKDPDGPCLI